MRISTELGEQTKSGVFVAGEFVKKRRKGQKRTFSDNVRRAIVKEAIESGNMTQTGKKYGIQIQTISRWKDMERNTGSKSRHTPTGKKYREYSDEEKATIVAECHKIGHTAVSKQRNIHVSNLLRWIRKAQKQEQVNRVQKVMNPPKIMTSDGRELDLFKNKVINTAPGAVNFISTAPTKETLMRKTKNLCEMVDTLLDDDEENMISSDDLIGINRQLRQIVHNLSK